MRLNRYQLTDGILGYLHRGGVLLPLGQTMEVLDFPIFVEPAAGQAEGWFLSENRTFALDLARGEAVIEGRRISVPKGLAEVHVDDIYVDTTLFATWFPLKMEFDLSRLTVTVTSEEPLPIEQRLEREKSHGVLGRAPPAPPVYPRVEIPRKAIDMPFLDVSSAASYDDKTGADIDYSALVTGDLLYMDANLFVSGNKDDTPRDVRFTLGRKDPDSQLLGPVKASEFAMGDIYTPQLPLVSRQTRGRGATVSNFPLFRPTEFDRTTLRGELPLGWEVELYRNEVLLDFRRSRSDGLYEFENVPLVFGSNVLRLVFYGPQGQRREEVQRYMIGTELTRPGKQYWRFAMNQQNEDLIPLGTGSSGGGNDADGIWRFFGEYEHGLTQNLSLASSVASIGLSSDGRRHNYGSIGLRSAVLGSFLRLDATGDTESGAAFQGSVQTDLYGVNILLDHARLVDFVSERYDNANDPVESETNLRLDTVIPSTVLPRLPFSVSGTIEQRQSGRYSVDLSNRASVFVAGVSASNALEARIDGGGDTEDQNDLRGSFLLNSRLERLILRGELDYDVHPDAALTNITLTGDYGFEPDVTLRGSVNRQLDGDQLTTASAGAFRTFDNFALGASGSYADDNSFTVGMSLSFGVGREPRTGSWAMRPRGIAADGAASARVFLDRNNDKHFNKGDKPLKGIGFERHRGTVTGENGVAFLTGLSSYQPSDIAIDTRTLEDPYWVPERPGVKVVPRPGKTVVVDFPVVPTGEIDGTVLLQRGGAATEVANVQLQLLDESGTVVRSIKTEFDGFYLFDRVTPGHYRVRVAPEQEKRLRLETPPPIDVAINTDGNVVSNLDLVLERKGEAAEPAAPVVALTEPDRPTPAAPGPTAPESAPTPAPRIPVAETPLAPARGEAVTNGPPPPDRGLARLVKGGHRFTFIQLASMSNLAAAKRQWTLVLQRHATLLNGLEPYVEEATIEGRGRFFRLMVGPFAKKAFAARICADLKKANGACILTTKDTNFSTNL